MWKVLLADDENLIVKGLRRLIDWSALDIEIVGEAMDGHQAEQLILQTRPDLVISDIRMPGLTGLELLSRHKGGPQAPKFIFVSGYEEFEYVRQALSGGAVDYLLKPVSAEELEKAVIPLIPMGQLIQPWDIAETILFLASEQARMITGQVIKVSGGKAL